MTKSMRSILVDWMVEVQESFELNHETLYLAVKLVDFYLMRQFVGKSKLQLIGATAVFIAAKFDVSVLVSLVAQFILVSIFALLLLTTIFSFKYYKLPLEIKR